MKERAITMRDFEVRSIREGRKTQTRRVIKPQPPDQPLANCHPRNSVKHPAPYLDAYCSNRKTAINPRGMSDLWCWWQVDDRQCLPTFRCPYGQPGDRLWVREAWRSWDERQQIIYKADYAESECRMKWRPSIHMPRLASRITLEIVSVRVERLQDITEADARIEGIAKWGDYFKVEAAEHPHLCARDAYCGLWESINGPGSWDLNPWVWVVEFKEMKP